MLKMWKTLLTNAVKPYKFKLTFLENLFHSFSVDIFTLFYTKSYYQY